MGTVDVELDLPNSDTWDTLHPGGLPVLQRPTAGEKRYARGGKFIVRIRPAPALTDSPLEVHYALCADGSVQDSLTDGIKLYERGIERAKVLVEDLPSGAVTHPTFFDLVDGCLCFSQYLCFSKFSRRANYRLRVVVKHGDWQCVGFSGAFKVLQRPEDRTPKRDIAKSEQARPQSGVGQGVAGLAGLGSVLPPPHPFGQPPSVHEPQLPPEQARSASSPDVQLLVDEVRARAPSSEQSVVLCAPSSELSVNLCASPVQPPPREQLCAVAPMLQPSAVLDVPGDQLRPQPGPLMSDQAHSRTSTTEPLAVTPLPDVRPPSREEPEAVASMPQPSMLDVPGVQLRAPDEPGPSVALPQPSVEVPMSLVQQASHDQFMPSPPFARPACVVSPRVQWNIEDVVDDHEIEESTDEIYGLMNRIKNGHLAAVIDEARSFARSTPLSRPAVEPCASSLGESSASSDVCSASEGASSPSSSNGAQSLGSDVAGGGPTPGNNGRGKPPPRSPPPRSPGGQRPPSSSRALHVAAQTDASAFHGATAVLPLQLRTVQVNLSQYGPKSIRLESSSQILASQMGSMNYNVLKADDDAMMKAFVFQQLEKCRHRKSLGVVAAMEHRAYCIDYCVSVCGFQKQHKVVHGAAGHHKHKYALKRFYMARGLYPEEPAHYETCFDEFAVTLMLKFGPSIVAATTVRLFQTVGGDIGCHVELYACDYEAYIWALARTENRIQTEYYSAALFTFLDAVMEAIGQSAQAREVFVLSQSVGFDYSISGGVIKQTMAKDHHSVSATTFWGNQLVLVQNDHTLVFLAAQLAALLPLVSGQPAVT